MPHIVLVHPEIPPNTGNIARTCAATAVELHLVAPLGFELSDRYLKRAGLDYWPYVKLHLHESVEAFWQHRSQRGGRMLGFTTSGKSNYLEIKYSNEDWLLFGCETKGLPANVLSNCQKTVQIPIIESSVRSLNLSVSVAIGLFEALRQLN